MPNGFTPARVQALTERVRVANRQQLVAVTRQKTAENQAAIRASTGREAAIVRFVDGSLGKPLEQAQQFTLTQFDIVEHVIDEIIATLIRNSPFGPEKGGHYRDDHWLFVNGARRDARTAGAVQIKAGDIVTVVNVRPYAAKLERGRRRPGTSERRPGLSVQAPNGIYEVSAQELRRRFRNIVNIRFTYRSVSGLPVPPRGGRASRYPCLEITAVGVA